MIKFNKNIIFNIVSIKKKKIFKNIVLNPVKYIKVTYYYRDFGYDNIIFSDLFFVIKKIENMCSSILSFKTINLRIKHKKKLFRKSFISLGCKSYENILSFIEFYLIYSLSYSIKSYIEKKKFKYMSQTFKTKKISKIILTKNNISFVKKFRKDFLNFNYVRKDKKLKKFNKKSMKFISVNLKFFGYISIYLAILSKLFITNLEKMFLFIYKYYRNKTLKI